VESLPQVAVIELGSQYTLLIERTLRELGVRSVILDPTRARSWLALNPVKAVILSGGAASIRDMDAPQPPDNLLELMQPDGSKVQVLGICYGMQWLAHRAGGTVKSVTGSREYGKAMIRVQAGRTLFRSTDYAQEVWASHGDSVVELPPDYAILALGSGEGIAAMANPDKTIWGVQFHPEVSHTVHGKTILGNFLFEIARCDRDWEASSMIAQIRQGTIEQLGDTDKAVFGFSGGVDSTTLAAALAPALGDRLLCVTIDAGHLREGEMYEIVRHAKAAGIKHSVVRASQLFLDALARTADAEEKRRLFKEIYRQLLIQAAARFGARTVIQGTLAPDRIESGATGGALIKSHHNVGLDMGGLRQLHPIDHLFKFEVRALAQELGLPASVWRRQPFPGPGLFIRIVGTPVTAELLETVRWADGRVREILERSGHYPVVSQVVVAYIGVNTVGVKGDARVYGGCVVVRAVETLDFMTAKGVRFPDEVKDEIESTLCQHPAIVRVVYDEMKKPPATTEWE
jgi:GMP synthase (glutamine-hydrolysing)